MCTSLRDAYTGRYAFDEPEANMKNQPTNQMLSDLASRLRHHAELHDEMADYNPEQARFSRDLTMAAELVERSGEHRKHTTEEEFDRGVWFRGYVTGRWYRKPEAAGVVDAVRIDGKVFLSKEHYVA